MGQEFEGQVAVVTGGARGIGRAIVSLLLRRGARVAILDVDEAGLEEAGDVLEAGERLLGVPTDVSDTNALRQARVEIRERFAQVNRTLQTFSSKDQRFVRLYFVDGHLLVNANRWYDAAGSASDTTVVIRDGTLGGTVEGYFELEGAAR